MSREAVRFSKLVVGARARVSIPRETQEDLSRRLEGERRRFIKTCGSRIYAAVVF